jgi:hypothetical protein
LCAITLRCMRAVVTQGNRPDLRFELIAAYCGINALVVHHRNKGGLLCEDLLSFGGPLVAVGRGTSAGDWSARWGASHEHNSLPGRSGGREPQVKARPHRNRSTATSSRSRKGKVESDVRVRPSGCPRSPRRGVRIPGVRAGVAGGPSAGTAADLDPLNVVAEKTTQTAWPWTTTARLPCGGRADVVPVQRRRRIRDSNS